MIRERVFPCRSFRQPPVPFDQGLCRACGWGRSYHPSCLGFSPKPVRLAEIIKFPTGGSP